MDRIVFCIDCLKENSLTSFLKNDSPKMDTYYKECTHCGGKAFLLDKPLKPVIKLLIEKGYQTQFSCSGHLYSKESSPYLTIKEEVDIDAPEGLVKIYFRGGTGLYSREMWHEDKLFTLKIQKRFIEDCLYFAKSLPQKKRKKFTLIDDDKKTILENKEKNVVLITGLNQSKEYLSNIKKINKIKDFRDLYNKTKKEERWIHIEKLEDLVWKFSDFYFENTLI